MNIFSNKKLSPEQEVNTLGKWLFKNLDGAIDYRKSSQQFNIWTIVLYSVPYEIRKQYELDEDYSEVHEMTINISLVTYKDRIRINLIEEDPDELTVGSKVYDLEKFDNYYELRDNMMNYLKVRLEKRYEMYDFLF